MTNISDFGQGDVHIRVAHEMAQPPGVCSLTYFSKGFVCSACLTHRQSIQPFHPSRIACLRPSHLSFRCSQAGRNMLVEVRIQVEAQAVR